ncbi:MAG: ABC transporter permease [Pseudomonadota bacterium]
MSPTDATAEGLAIPSREAQAAKADNVDSRGRLLAADGTPLKASLRRALRREKLRAFMLVAPLLAFILITFIAPIGQMLTRSIGNEIVPTTIPGTLAAMGEWDPSVSDAPDERVFQALFFDMFLAAELKEHTKLGTRLNYEQQGMSSLFRGAGRQMDNFGEPYQEFLEDEIDEAWDTAAYWTTLMTTKEGGAAASDLTASVRARLQAMTEDAFAADMPIEVRADMAALLPQTATAYTEFLLTAVNVEEDDPLEEEPWEAVHAALAVDLADPDLRRAATTYAGPGAELLNRAAGRADEMPPLALKEAFLDDDEDWGDREIWGTIKQYAGVYTAGYYLAAVDMAYSPEGEVVEASVPIYLTLFWRTLVLSVTITGTCLLLGYPIAWLLANLPMRTANLLLILVLLPFWTSLLVRTSSWIVLLQDQGVINDVLVFIGIVADNNRLQMMFNEVGTVVAMTHILLPFMILPLFSVMKTIPPSYLRAAKSLGATNFTAFWRVYFPQTVPGIGAGAILVFILAIGYYITPELVGGTSGIFISNRIAYHISSSLNWGLAAALGSLLLIAVLVLYWLYDKIVGIDNVKLG